MRQTPLHTVHASHGATFTTFAGWHMPLRYSSEIAEHHAVRQTAGSAAGQLVDRRIPRSLLALALPSMAKLKLGTHTVLDLGKTCEFR